MTYKPTIYLTDKDLPKLKDYEVGDTYTAIYRCKVVGKHINDKGKVSGDLEILDIKPIDYGGSINKVKVLVGKR